MASGDYKPRFTISEIRDRLSERRAKRRLKALALLLASGLVIVQVFPTLAENSSEVNESYSETTTVTTPPEIDSPTSPPEGENVTNSGSDSAQTDVGESTDNTSAPSPTPPPPPPPYATENQNIFITMPSSLRVDPRASVVFLPQSSFYSANTLMVCITSNSLSIDLGQVGGIDDTQSDLLMLSGDRTNSVIIAGNSALVSGYLNSDKGLRLFREGGGIANQGALFRFVDISEPTLDAMLCGDGALANSRFLQIVPLGLNQNISKAKVGLEKRKK